MNSNAELKVRTEEIRNDIEHMVEMCGSMWESDTLVDYLDDAEVEYRINSKLEYVGAYIYIELGGATTWIDTYHKTLESSWGSYKASVPLSLLAVETIDSLMREYYNCTRDAR